MAFRRRRSRRSSFRSRRRGSPRARRAVSRGRRQRIGYRF